MGFSAAVLFGLSGSGAAAHTDIFDSASKSCRFVAFKMGQADKYVSIHHCPSDLCSFYIFAAFYRHIYIIGSLKAVSDNDGTSHGQRSKAVFPCALHMLQGIFSAAWIHGITVCKEGLSAQLFYYINNGPGIIGTQVADISQLSEMHLDRNKFSIQIQVFNPSLFDQLF